MEARESQSIQWASMQVGQIGRPKEKKASNSASSLALGPQAAAAAAHGVAHNCVSDKLRTLAGEQ